MPEDVLATAAGPAAGPAAGVIADAGVPAPTPADPPPGGGVASPVPPTTALAPGSLPLEALHDVELRVEVVLGRARMTLRDLLSAHPGTTIELDRSVRSAADVMVNGTLFARAEVVVVDDSEMGVQITEVVGLDVAREGRS